MVFENKDSFSGFWLNMPHFLIAFIIFILVEYTLQVKIF